MKLHLLDLNFLEEFKDVEIDNQITPLICAASLGRIECVKLLLENDTIDVNLASNASKFTPIGVACATANYEVLKLLLDHGADVNKDASFQQPPLVYCFTRLQEESNLFENQLICMKMAELLLKNGADINAIINPEKGYSLLMQFCAIKIELTDLEKQTNAKVIKFLLEHGANRELMSKKGKTAFELAERHCNKIEIQNMLKNVKQTHFYEERLRTLPPPPIKKKWLSCEGASIWSSCCTSFKWCK